MPQRQLPAQSALHSSTEAAKQHPKAEEQHLALANWRQHLSSVHAVCAWIKRLRLQSMARMQVQIKAAEGLLPTISA